jgi:hypothetical protein
MGVKLRIARLVVDGHSSGDARLMLAAFREELARLVAEPGAVEALSRVPPEGSRHVIEAATPAGHGRQAARRMVRP